MKVLFLDIDGPMIPARAAILSPGSSWTRFDPVAVAHLNDILSKDVTLVMSSSWRVLGSYVIRVTLSANGIDPAHLHNDWAVPHLSEEFNSREKCIKDWLVRHQNISHWIALDDMKLDLPEQNLVRVSTVDGMLYSHVREIKNKLWLNEPSPLEGLKNG